MCFATWERPRPVESSRWGWSQRRAVAREHHQHQRQREHHQHQAWLSQAGSTHDGRERAARTTSGASTISISASRGARAPPVERKGGGRRAPTVAEQSRHAAAVLGVCDLDSGGWGFRSGEWTMTKRFSNEKMQA
jgi:hypothetical protein